MEPPFDHMKHSVPPGLDEVLETVTRTRRGNTIDPEVRNPALQDGEGSFSKI